MYTHEHAYILDSNKELDYDFTMFCRHSGKINNNGMRNIFENLKWYIDTIQYHHNMNSKQQQINNQEESDQDTLFFRD